MKEFFTGAGTKLSEFGAFLCFIFAAIGTTISPFLGGWDILIKCLAMLMLVDYVTGVFCAIVSKSLNSQIGFIGIARKIFIFLLIGIAVSVDNATNSEVLRTLTILFYISNEGISVLENAGKLGLPYPEQMKTILEQLKKKDK